MYKNSESKVYELALGLIAGIGNVLAKQLVSYCGSAENIFKINKNKLLAVPGIGNQLADEIINQSVLRKAEEDLQKINRENVKLLFFTDAEYPIRLKGIFDAPVMLYYKGNASLNFTRGIAIVGTRNATEYGKAMTEDIVRKLVPFSPTIVSGLAYGIDIIAHKEALKERLPTIGVLGSGVDVIYPALHKSVVNSMLNQGGLLSENPLGTKPDPHLFPARNRIVAGMTDVTIIVEAAERGGALITAEYANEYNKEVFAVPGDLRYLFSEGCNKLIKNHKANIFTSVNDMIEVLNWDLNTNGNKSMVKKEEVPLDLSMEERKVFDILKVKELQIDEISWQSGLAINKLASILLSLEFQGIVKPMPGKIFKLVS